ncbi:lytic murein transglycosylase [Breoghania sp. L-A4]|uniref:lytic murein transglycosylase n=1 Tax=Breoghania sp. L-A4 TaxID=2304600 RepID=UPI000E35815D|nr:lytic murein transglycosylase [Breoghania sp. L-A4]AXS39631.1 lytic murein transglycosylase [Breoghania sp. L-A4]
MRIARLIAGAALAAVLGCVGPAAAASCGNGPGGFNAWLADFKRQAVAQGISQRTVNAALKGVSYNPRVIKLDRSQKSFKLSFDQFYKRRVDNAMIKRGRALMASNRRLFDSIERQYGVPAEVIVAIWGLETGFGRNSGSMPAIRSLATLAYDCRRSDFFTNELMSALTIVQRGDMAPANMKGAWAGELGQTQFLASSYVKYAVDYDGNGRRDLIRSVPDVLASTANYLKQYGWRRGQSWEPGSANYDVLFKWNRAKVYVQTISVMASKLRG